MQHGSLTNSAGKHELTDVSHIEAFFSKLKYPRPAPDPVDFGKEKLMKLAKGMILSEEDSVLEKYRNLEIPAGYTLLGQFVGHDVTFDTNRRDGEGKLKNSRSPFFDLDSVYGRGPEAESILYDNKAEYVIAKVRYSNVNLRRLSKKIAIKEDEKNKKEVYENTILELQSLKETIILFSIDTGISTSPLRGNINQLIDFLKDLLKAEKPRDIVRLKRLVYDSLIHIVNELTEMSAAASRETILQGMLLRMGITSFGEDDLPREADGKAIIGDVRNDENIIISQLHVVFIKFHNRVLREIILHEGRPKSQEEAKALFEKAKGFVIHAYQRVILDDLIMLMVGEEIINKKLDRKTGSGGKNYTEKTKFIELENIQIPIEFAAAAFRMGHSMIGAEYRLNLRMEDVIPLFSKDPANSLLGGRFLPRGWTIDWRIFFNYGIPQEGFQYSQKIDTNLVYPLGHVPTPSGKTISLAIRNLLKSSKIGLLSGKQVAKLLGVENAKIEEDNPLWYYILEESGMAPTHGDRVGELGSLIIAEVVIALLAKDEKSFLNAEPVSIPHDPLKYKQGHKITMKDIVKYASDPIPYHSPMIVGSHI